MDHYTSYASLTIAEMVATSHSKYREFIHSYTSARETNDVRTSVAKALNEHGLIDAFNGWIAECTNMKELL